jgi:5-methylcytosine-specific restriction endonuclease McrA
MKSVSPSLGDLISQLFKSTKNTDQLLAQAVKEGERIKIFYAPRARFERWRDSIDGKAWKEAQYSRQKGCCAACQCAIELKGSHIDHIKPISKYPELALDIKNFRICCVICNTSKQANIS